MSFDPSAPISADDGIFGLPYSRQESAIVLLPVPWDVTTSYKAGTHKGPEAIRKASEQLDLFDLELGHAYENGYFMESSSEELLSLNHKTRPQAELVMAEHLKASPDKELIKKLTSEVNDACETMNRWVYENAQQVLSEGKVPGVVGGDHSTPFGNMQAVSEATTEYGVLHIDAHCDLRVAYQGFEYSHASIMYNLLKLDNAPKSLVQIGIRDFCEEEYNVTQEDPRIHTFYDLPLAESLSKGQTWDAICEEVVKPLPEKVYLSIDIDGLNPSFCPNTGTPVPGGLTYHQVILLLKKLTDTGRKIIGFDLVEVAPEPSGTNEWDGNVGARLLFQICGRVTQ